MVKNRLAQSDAQSNGWLLDGYPRSASQGAALEAAGIRPELFLLLEASPSRVDCPLPARLRRAPGARRCRTTCWWSTGPMRSVSMKWRRLDPQTGKIYHLKFAPPPAEAVPRLTVRSDDTEEKARNRLAVHARNVDAVRGMYKNCVVQVDGNRDKNTVFNEISAKIAALK